MGPALAALDRVQILLRLTQGSESLGEFARVIDRLLEAAPQIKRETIRGAGHVPQLTVPQLYAETIVSFVRAGEASAARSV
jgi:pimeloyl-ACP methyl ester carboxylesterase